MMSLPLPFDRPVVDIHLQAANAADLPLARALARRGMLPYYIAYDLVWLDQAFDDTWQWREQWVVRRGEEWLGFLSLSCDQRALYIRELHLVESARGQGVGSLVLEKVQGMACERQLPRVRLTVFKSNRAQHLYLRRGFRKVGEDDCFYRMERTVSPKIE
jgi:ribosomal protein S18 acetylase RimI-like enzyme